MHLSTEELSSIMQTLAEIHSHAESRYIKDRCLSIGVLIKREIDELPNGRISTKEFDKQKLFADNQQLIKENQALSKRIRELEESINRDLPNINEKISILRTTFNDIWDKCQLI